MTNISREEWNQIRTNGDREKVEEVDPKKVEAEEQVKFGLQIFLLILTLYFLIMGLYGYKIGFILFCICICCKIFYRLPKLFNKYGESIRNAIKSFFSSVFGIGLVILYFIVVFRIGAWIYAGVGGGVIGILALLRFFGR